MPPKQTPFCAQPRMTKSTTTLKTVTTKASVIGKRTMWFAPKTTTSSPVKKATLV